MCEEMYLLQTNTIFILRWFSLINLPLFTLIIEEVFEFFESGFRKISFWLCLIRNQKKETNQKKALWKPAFFLLVVKISTSETC